MEDYERINLLIDAQADINNAIRKIKIAIEDTSQERYCETYIIGHLDNWANSDHGLDTTIPKLIQIFEEGEE